MSKEIVLRSRKVSFMEVDGGTYKRMTGFTSLVTNKNPEEYTRKYVDEDFETTDIIGMSTAVDYEFDQMKDNAVHDKLIEIADDELLGVDAVVSIAVVDLSQEGTETTAPVAIRDFVVVPESDGDGTEAYTYSGAFRVQGERVKGTATTTDGWKTMTITEEP